MLTIILNQHIIDIRKIPSLLILLEALNRIFEENTDSQQHIHQGKCLDCGCEVKIEISKTSGGFGFFLRVSNASRVLRILLPCASIAMTNP